MENEKQPTVDVKKDEPEDFLLSENLVDSLVNGISVSRDSPGDTAAGDGTNDSSAE
jgi:hypothetical protein